MPRATGSQFIAQLLAAPDQQEPRLTESTACGSVNACPTMTPRQAELLPRCSFPLTFWGPRPEELPTQLQGRLVAFSDAGLEHFRRQIEQETSWPWMKSLWPALAAPGGPQLRTLTGHQAFVSHVKAIGNHRCVSGTDGIFSFDKDVNSLRVWRLHDGSCEFVLSGHGARISAVAVAHDLQRVVSASNDRTLRVWNLSSGACEHVLEGHSDGITAIAITPDNQHVISASSDHTLRKWNIETGRCEAIYFGHTAGVSCLALILNQNFLVSGSTDQSLRIWQLDSGQCVQSLFGHTGAVFSLLAIDDAGQIVSGSADGTLRVWHLEDGRCERRLTGHSGAVSVLTPVNDGQTVVSGSEDRTLRVWNIDSGECVHVLEGHAGWIQAVTTTSDDRYVVSGAGPMDHQIRIWDLEQGSCEKILHGHADGITGLDVTPDGRYLLSCSKDRAVGVWQAISPIESAIPLGTNVPRLLSFLLRKVGRLFPVRWMERSECGVQGRVAEIRSLQVTPRV